MESIELKLFSTTIYIGLFIHVNNSSKIKEQLIQVSRIEEQEHSSSSFQRNSLERERLNWSFIDASMITSRQHLMTAIFQALVSRSNNQLKTKTIHSEILWCLSPGTNITEAIKKFGIGDKTRDVILVKVKPTDNDYDNNQKADAKERIEHSARCLILGDMITTKEIGNRSIINMKEIRKQYKLNEDVIINQLEKDKKNIKKDISSNSNSNLIQLDNQLFRIVDQLVSVAVAVKSVAA